jgi:NAD(P)H-dependent flavin oxidoreductase YrpB (nitropropane dioxygenase family)
MLAGMNVAAGPKLAAAVSNAGGIGVIGGVGYTPDMLREQIAELKGFLQDKNAPFGVDLLLPQVGGSARKTKYVATNILRDATDMLISTPATTTPRASSTNSLISSSIAVQSCSSPLLAFHPRP